MGICGNGKQYFVTLAGSDSNDGLTIGSAFATIDFALQGPHRAIGDTIRVGNGVWDLGSGGPIEVYVGGRSECPTLLTNINYSFGTWLDLET